MGFLNNILLDVAIPPEVTEVSKVTDNAGTVPVIIILSVAAAVAAAALILLILAARKRRKQRNA
jgi:NADH:ubiquinone oxidoreductase subunit K